MFLIKFEALTLGEKIGEGGFGIVYKGTYRFGSAAIKQLRIDNLSPEAEEEFNKEAKIMAELHHPNIVHFYGYCSIPKCLVMEYMPKGSLFKIVHNKSEALDWSIRIRIASDIASGLAFLHSKDILHRDIKSLNVLLDAQLGARLTDFGLSKVKNETKSKSTATKTHQSMVGTVQWMAPELFKRKAVYTQKSDIYSLGITFWELAARKIPYAEDEQGAIPAFVQQGEREDIPPDCPPKLAHLIQQCWAGNPEERPNAFEVATFMTSDAKTLKEQAIVNATPSLSYPLRSDAGYQVTSQIASDFAPTPVTLHTSAASLKLPSHVGSPVTVPQVVSATVVSVPKPAVLEQTNPPGPAMLNQFQASVKPVSQVSDSALTAFLKLIEEGEQDKAEGMLFSMVNQHGPDEVIRVLKAKAVHVDKLNQYGKENKDGQTLMYIAAQKGHVANIAVLKAVGVNVDKGLHYASGSTCTPLEAAIFARHTAAITALIAAGANVNANHYVYWAARQGQATVITALANAGASVNSQYSQFLSSYEYGTPVLIAAENGHAEAIRALHAAGANVNTQMSNGVTPVYSAAENGHAEAIRALHAAKANVDTPNKDGITPVNIAAQFGHAEAIRVLYAAGANVNTPDKDGATPVFIAARGGHASSIAALVTAGADVETLNKDGWTPLHIAARNGRAAAITALLETGADASIKTPGWLGSTALDIAKQGKGPEHPEIVRLLKAHFKQYSNGIKPIRDIRKRGGVNSIV